MNSGTINHPTINHCFPPPPHSTTTPLSTVRVVFVRISTSSVVLQPEKPQVSRQVQRRPRQLSHDTRDFMGVIPSVLDRALPADTRARTRAQRKLL